jgi:predicted RNA-binding Zn ribbon-like protein
MAGTNSKESAPAPFELIAGNVCLDFINTLDNRPTSEPEELLKNYSDLARFGEQSGILTREQRDFFSERIPLKPDQARKAMLRARNLREALHHIFWALVNNRTAPPGAIDTLNENLQDAALHSRLIQHKRHLEWRFDDLTSSFTAMLWPIARAATDLLTSSDLSLVRTCSAPTCLWFFLDTSKNHHRRWCSMKLCGNRTKVRRFYARQKNAH